LKEQR